jgi:hypothetical protein
MFMIRPTGGLETGRQATDGLTSLRTELMRDAEVPVGTRGPKLQTDNRPTSDLPAT